MNNTDCLIWEECGERPHGFAPHRLRSAVGVVGRYEVFQTSEGFDCWLVKRLKGELMYLGASRTANGARMKCELHARAPKKPAGGSSV
jgi:hypothetical protein